MTQPDPPPNPKAVIASPWQIWSGFGLTLRWDRRAPRWWCIYGSVLMGLMLLSLRVGEVSMSAIAVLKAVVRWPDAPPDHVWIVWTLRMPRAIVAALVGMGLAVAGTILQSLTQNPLAAPGILGLNSGASLAAVMMIVLVPQVSAAWLPVAALVGAFAATAIALGLAGWGQAAPLRLILVGIGVSALAGAGTTLLMTVGQINAVSQALAWLTGTVYGRSWAQVGALLPWWMVGMGGAIAAAPWLNRLSLGDDLAQGLGSRVAWERRICLLWAVLLAGSAVATAGAIAFVGLIAPHWARQQVGPHHQGLIPTAALVGGGLVVLADVVGRGITAVELPCGVLTAALGAPYFLVLLWRDRT